MTRLLDTGYLETDDPVVAACFIGHDIRSGWVLHTITLDLTDLWSESEQARLATAYPILIPAAVVAEVCELKKHPMKVEHWTEVTYPPNLAAIIISRKAKSPVYPWLCKHTGEDG